MHDPTMDDFIYRTIVALWFAGSVFSIYLAGRIAERRGRSFKTWAWISGILIGPLALALLLLLPNLQRRDPNCPERPNSEKRRTETIGAAELVIPGNPHPGRLGMSFA